jgi:hypothetical protein
VTGKNVICKPRSIQYRANEASPKRRWTPDVASQKTVLFTAVRVLVTAAAVPTSTPETICVSIKSLKLREEHRLRVSENRVLRKIFGPKRDEMTGGWRKLYNEELHNLYSSPSIIISRIIKSRRMQWVGPVARMVESRTAYRISVGKPEGKRRLGRPKRWWVDNIKIDIREIGWGGVDWISLRIGTSGGLL